MGYYTSYSLEVENGTKEIREALTKRFGIDDSGEMGDECKWYDHEEDMIGFSREFPDAIFHLRGVGENSADIWEKDFKGGRVQVRRAKMVIPPYNPKWP